MREPGNNASLSRCACVVIGVSAGGTAALPAILSVLPADYAIPLVVVRHLHPDSGPHGLALLGNVCALRVDEALDKMPITVGVHVAPPNYHLLIEEDRRFALSIDERVRWARPSIDVLFESAAHVYGETLTGIILTGANDDGSRGLRRIKEFGGMAIVQDPATAEYADMPRAAIAACAVDQVLSLPQIGEALEALGDSAQVETKKPRAAGG